MIIPGFLAGISLMKAVAVVSSVACPVPDAHADAAAWQQLAVFRQGRARPRWR